MKRPKKNNLYYKPSVFFFALLLFFPPFFAKISHAQEPKIISFKPESGKAGSRVSILGKNFSKVKTENIVKFGGKKTNVLKANETGTRLTMKVPKSAWNSYS